MRAGESAATLKNARQWGVFLMSLFLHLALKTTARARWGIRSMWRENLKNNIWTCCVSVELSCAPFYAVVTDISRWSWSPQTLLCLRTSGKNPLRCPVLTSVFPRPPLSFACFLSVLSSLSLSPRLSSMTGHKGTASRSRSVSLRCSAPAVPAPLFHFPHDFPLSPSILWSVLWGFFVHISRETHPDFYLSAPC